MSIGLYDYFLKHNYNVGFIKPVGQRYVAVNNKQIDKDSYLMEHIFQSKVDIKLTSPIAIPRGFTEEYIEHRETQKNDLQNRLIESFNELSKNREVMILEGTGHAGVGSILDLSNAQVAQMLNAKVVLIVPGGIGNTVDEIMLNKALFDQLNVEILGVIVNKTFERKYEKVKNYVSKALKNYGIKILGFVPYQRSLSSPNMFLIKEALKADIINEGDCMYDNIEDVVVGAMTPHYVLSHLKKRSLLITPGDREDILLAGISMAALSEENQLSGIILTGGILPKENIYRLITKTSIPILYVAEDTYITAKKVSTLNVKITINDKKKIELSKELITQYVDTDYIINYL